MFFFLLLYQQITKKLSETSSEEASLFSIFMHPCNQSSVQSTNIQRNLPIDLTSILSKPQISWEISPNFSKKPEHTFFGMNGSWISQENSVYY